MLFLILIGAVTCARSFESDKDSKSTSSSSSSNSYTSSDLTTSTTYFWKVVASDSKGGRGESDIWSIRVQ